MKWLRLFAVCSVAALCVVVFSDSRLLAQTAHEEHDGHEGEDAHEHPEVGPHGGHLIELGEEAFHAELVHDEEHHTVTIHLLDSAATKLIAIPAPFIVINLVHDGKAEQFKLMASPIETDPKGSCSRYMSEDPELCEDLDHEEVKAKLVVMIGKKQFVGEIAHEHGHEEKAAHTSER